MTHVTVSQAIEMIAIAVLTMGFIKKWPQTSYFLRALAVRKNKNHKILREAVTAIYLGGGERTYTGALWTIVREIDQEVAELLANDELAAYNLVNPEEEDEE